ncbi:NADP-dependent oxidoreductase [Microscilla marina]|uniref:Alcohol dehydrogenase, zinc-containing n=1 Tax=Microscilla marina ATCC 23134 TaxID=313606 RepID=A1ZDN0_MICM2|nr:NADP-dependent oxidoreductase [Microscilla marina]EAY31769.1 alcohol dehydrogenase, zinc-containing [Microscilla marina ATCC 23134]
MKALQLTQYGAIDKSIAFAEIAVPQPKSNQVLIKVHSAAINPIDYHLIEGSVKQVIKLDFPTTLGLDLSGTVTKVGTGVTNFAEGDEVYTRVPSESPGTFAEYIAVDSNVVAKKPHNIGFEASSSIPLVGLTTVQALAQAQIKSGDKILIHAGSGGVGSFAIQYAKTKGAYVYTTTSTKNVDWVKKLGADRVIDYTKENYLEIVKDADIVYDTLGDKYTEDAFQVIKQGGKVISIVGKIDDQTAKEFGLNSFIRFLLALKRRKITKLSRKKKAYYRMVIMQPNAQQLNEISTLVEKEAIKPVIDKVFSFDQAKEALLYQKSGRAKGKIILKVL